MAERRSFEARPRFASEPTISSAMIFNTHQSAYQGKDGFRRGS